MRIAEQIEIGAELSTPKSRAESDASGARSALALRRLWVSAQSAEWRVLALVPAEPGAALQGIGRALEDVGRREAGEALLLTDGSGLSLRQSTALAEQVRAQREAGGRTLLVVDAPGDEPAAVPLLRHADAVVIGVRQGRTTLADVRRTRQALGQARVLGAVLVTEAE